MKFFKMKKKITALSCTVIQNPIELLEFFFDPAKHLMIKRITFTCNVFDIKVYRNRYLSKEKLG